MFLFFASALLLGSIAGAAAGYSKFGRLKAKARATQWALWLVAIAALFAATYGMSVPVCSYQVSERQLYIGLGVAATSYLVVLLVVKWCAQRAQVHSR